MTTWGLKHKVLFQACTLLTLSGTVRCICESEKLVGTRRPQHRLPICNSLNVILILIGHTKLPRNSLYTPEGSQSCSQTGPLTGLKKRHFPLGSHLLFLPARGEMPHFPPETASCPGSRDHRPRHPGTGSGDIYKPKNARAAGNTSSWERGLELTLP